MRRSKIQSFKNENAEFAEDAEAKLGALRVLCVSTF